MKGAKRPLGYTIIEVMIVLAISGVMFSIAATFIGGKSEATAFTEGVNGLASQIQNTIQQVTNGQYSDIPLDCNLVSAGPPASIAFFVGTNTQGTNAGCVFLGKIFAFTGSSPYYKIGSLAGGQVNPDSPAFIGVNTTAQQMLTDSDATAIPGLVTSEVVPQQINITGMSEIDASGATQSYNNFGFILNLGTPDGNGGFQSGAEPVSLVYNPSPGFIWSTLQYIQSVTISLSDGAERANILIGSSNNQLGVTIKWINAQAI